MAKTYEEGYRDGFRDGFSEGKVDWARLQPPVTPNNIPNVHPKVWYNTCETPIGWNNKWTVQPTESGDKHESN
jgi:hypothetical protein